MAQHRHLEYFRIPPEIHFEGLISDTYTMQRAGWQVVQVMDDYSNSIMLTLKHSKLDLVMQTNSIRVERDAMIKGLRHRFEVVRMSPTRSVQVFEPFSLGALVDCTPGYSKTDAAYGDWAIFGPPVVKTLEVLVEPSSVLECLELIQKLQSPKLAAIRAENRERDLRTAYTQHINAKIMSVA